MEKFLEKISAYELLNNLLPGTLLCALLNWHTGGQFAIDNVFVEIISFYSAGLIIGRIGSLVIEPLFKKLKIIRTADYKDFIAASEKDPKIDVLSTKNNLYRTFTALFLLYAVFLISDWIIKICPILQRWIRPIAIILLILLFSFSYRKQTNYIRNRVNIQNAKTEQKEEEITK